MFSWPEARPPLMLGIAVEISYRVSASRVDVASVPAGDCTLEILPGDITKEPYSYSPGVITLTVDW